MLSKRLEFSISYLVAGLLGIAFLVVVAGAVRLGQVYPDKTIPFLAAEPAEGGKTDDSKRDIRETLFGVGPGGQKSGENENNGGNRVTKTPIPPVKTVVPPVKTEVVLAKPQGKNLIVIQGYSYRKDLVPVQEH